MARFFLPMPARHDSFTVATGDYMRFSVQLFALAAAVLAAPIAASAQSTPATPPPTNTVTAPDSAPVGPTISSSVAYRPAASTDSLSLEPQHRKSQGFGQAGALMIAGGAGVVVGLLIGDDVGTLIAVGGAIVGLYGLYMYLK
jgi:hypothetical protein